MAAENLLKEPRDDHYVHEGSLGASRYRDFQVILPLSTTQHNAVFRGLLSALILTFSAMF